MDRDERPGKRQRTAPIDIPEDIIRDILTRLPSRSVLRFRSVCKAWLRIMSDPAFAAAHHRVQPALPLVSFLRGEERAPVTDCCVEALDLQTSGFRSAVRFTDSEERCGRFHIHGSCDGLLLLSFDARFYVCNPTTRQWTSLPTPISSSYFAGFYRHEHTGEYRALFYRDPWPPGESYYILVEDARKGIGLLTEKTGYKLKVHPGGPPTLVRGSLHWPPEWRYEYAILVFDTATEVLSVMFTPVVREHSSLLEMNGELAMFTCGKDARVVELWLMQDYSNEIWVCKHRVRLPKVKATTFNLHEPWRLFFMSEGGAVLVTTDTEQKLLYFDSNGELRESFRCDGRNLRITPYTLKESLVRHAFFDKQHNADDGKDESPPPFFQGL